VLPKTKKLEMLQSFTNEYAQIQVKVEK